MNVKDRIARMEARARRIAARGDERHHQIDAAFDELERTRERLVETFTSRLDQIEKNTARIADLVAGLEAHAGCRPCSCATAGYRA